MSSATSSSSFLYFLVIIALVVIVRMRRVINGTKVSTARSLVYSIVYFLFAAFAISGSYFLGVSPFYFALDALVLIVGAFWAWSHAGKNLVFWKSGGSIFVKGATVIYVIYVVGLISRLAIEYVYVPNYFSFSQSITTLSSTGLAATIVTDILLSFGIGLLVGRNIEIVKRYNRIRSGAVPVRDSAVA